MIKFLRRWVAAAAVCVFSPGLFAQTEVSVSGKDVNPQPYYADPGLSPDGTEIAFASGGDIWTVPAAGGEARLLISHPDNDSRPVYSPDGKYLVFNSTRTGNGDVYLLNFSTNEIRRLTYDDGLEEASAWSPDGRFIYFSSSAKDISGMRDIFRIKVDGGTPMPVSNRRYMSEYFGVPSPDGKTVAFVARGIASQQWWRKGHSHLDETEIWLLHQGKEPRYEQLTERNAKELWPMWSADGKVLYYVSDKSGAQNLWAHPLGGAPTQLTRFTSGRVLWPTISQNGRSLVFERDFNIWKYDLASGQTTQVKITRRGAPASTGVEHMRITSQFRELALSPDGKKIAFVAHGEVFVAPAKEGGDAFRVTTSPANETGVVWSPTSNVLVYISDRDGVAHLYQYDFITAKENRLTNGSEDDATPLFSPNGKQVSFIRNGEELRVLDLATAKETLVTKGIFGRSLFSTPATVAWSPDGKWLAFSGHGPKSFRNIYVVPASGGEAKQVSFLANSFGGTVSWSADGSYILFSTAQRTEMANVARVDLVPQRPRFREDQFQQMFVEQTTSPSVPANPAAPKIAVDKTKSSADTLAGTQLPKPSPADVRVISQGIRQRLNLLPLNVDVNNQSISKDGKTLLVTASVAGQMNLFTYSLDELAKEPAVLKQITFTPGAKASAQFSADGKEVYFLEQGRIQSVALDTKTPKPIAVSAEMDVDFNKEKLAVFQQAWDIQNESFYDPAFHGADWKEVRAQYEPLAAGANTPDELRRLLSLMVGELNASHLGVSGPAGSGGGFTTGRLGVTFDRAAYEEKGQFKITEVITLGAADLAGGIKAGDYLLAVDEKPLDAGTNLDELLQNKIDRKVILTFGNSPSGGSTRKVTVRPVNAATEKGLLYKQWVQQQRDYVAKISNGRLGYVHMFDMSQQSLDQLYLDMDAENHTREGVIVDVRNNNGGFVNAYALDVLARRGYMTMQVRGLPPAPARTQLGQRALDAPTILVTNQHSLSDAEDFTEGYRTLGLGKVVGEPTAGWIIYTTNLQLLDGTTFRLPFSRITDHEGKDMELHPRPVDIPVSNSFNDGNEKDAQLETAVSALLKDLDAKKSLK
jgi:Tol biopolymer transport system component/C-terminal processing protease CtpA/Prc